MIETIDYIYIINVANMKLLNDVAHTLNRLVFTPHLLPEGHCHSLSWKHEGVQILLEVS
jgi:hypothetical protein